MVLCNLQETRGFLGGSFVKELMVRQRNAKLVYYSDKLVVASSCFFRQFSRYGLIRQIVCFVCKARYKLYDGK